MKRSTLLTIVALALFASLILSACGAPAEPAADTGGGDAAAEEGGGKLLFWSTESQPERVAKTNELLAKFTEQSGIEVELVPVDEGQLSQLLTASAAANTLPDVMFFPLDFAIGWADQGILDYTAAKEVIDSLDPATFSEGPLNMVSYEDGYAGVPSDGWGQC